MAKSQRPATQKERIKYEIIEQLALLPADAPIEPELQLAQKYGVSRGTVRQAITELVGEGLLYRVQGSGTFKNKVAINHISSLSEGFSKQLKRSGFTSEIADIVIGKCPLPAKYAKALETPANTEVWKFSRIWKAGSKPISYGEAFIRKDVIREFRAEAVTDSFLETLETGYGIHISYSESYAGAVGASEFLAQKLHIAVGMPLLRYEYYGYDKDHRSIFVDTSYTIGDKYILHVSQNFDA